MMEDGVWGEGEVEVLSGLKGDENVRAGWVGMETIDRGRRLLKPGLWLG